ncbi:MAG: hypothetical protein Q9179_004711 [Wetmoreana sp. 5 TL-2023]
MAEKQGMDPPIDTGSVIQIRAAHNEVMGECPSGSQPSDLHGRLANTHQLGDDERPMDNPPESSNDDTTQREIEEMIDEKIESFDELYNPSVEVLPSMPAYHPSFAKVEAYYEDLLDDAIQMLENTLYSDAVTKRILHNAKERRKVKYSHARNVGFVGDSGVGKSSLVNALLDTPELALTGGSGSACTCVITEYHQARPSQTTRFKAEIVLFDEAKIKSILKGHLHDCWVNNNTVKEETDPDAFEDVKNKFDTAFEVFQALFADHEEFQDRTKMSQFLEDMESSEDDGILKKLLRWTDDAISINGAVNGLIYRSGESTQSFGHNIETFVKMGVKRGPGATPSLWPVVRFVRVGLHSPLLKRGLVIADLPGLSDMSRTRTSATNQYVRSCNYLFLVAPIARVQTDNLVDRRLSEYMRRFGSRVALACTKTDDVPGNACPQGFSATDQATWEYTNLSRAFEQMGIYRTKLVKEKNAAKGTLKANLGEELNALRYITKLSSFIIGAYMGPAYAAGLHESILVMRNRKVESAMRMKYNEENPPVENLNIYCVSSAAYELNAKGYNDEDIPVSVNATGIPKLRAFMARVAAEEKLNVLQNHCSGHLPSMMSSLESWSLRLTMDRRREMRRVVAKPGESVETVIAALARKIKDQLDDTLLNTLPFDDIAVVPTETFMKSLSPKKVQLRELVDTFSAKGLQSSRDVRLNVITDDTEDAFLLRELGPVYQACAAEAGMPHCQYNGG